MKCPKCQFENREGAIFCGKCGAGLSLVCPKCNAENPPANSFCDKCGHNLSLPSEPAPRELSYDEKIDKIQRYLPKGLTDKILSQRDKIEGERKQVTVMFCDMEGFTSLSERLGPEEAYDIVDQIYELLIHKVHDYEGTVNEMTGDGIVALFGAPIALEDAPQRAIRSATAIHREMSRFSDRMKEEREGLPTLRMRIGIHTGPVVVGTVGNNLRVEFKAVGDTVNLASRMEGLARPGATYVTEDTFKLTEGFFRFEALGEKEVKGKKEPIKVYRAIAPSTRRTRFDVSAERGLTPFVGRDREIELLLDAFERAKTGRGQAISIMSEAGVGKSRLLFEFRKAVANEDITFLEAKCLSYSRGIAYHPVIDILKSNFDVLEGDGDVAIRGKVKEGLRTLGLDEASTLPYFLELMSVRDSGIDNIMMSPEGKKDQIIEALKRIVLKGSEIRPLILAYEDLHWADRSSEEVLKYVLESIPRARVLMIFTYRPEFVHTWGAKSYHSQVNLNRLSNRESLVMVSYLLGTEEIDSDLEELILEKTEGVPFFIEEFIRSLKDLKIIEKRDNKYHLAKDIQEVAIPSTIQDVIMARVDTLPEGAKDLLQTGSVIEREFSYELIKRVTRVAEQELLSHLSILKDSELLYERGIYPQSTYIFKHALTREVMYDSILTRRKKRLHEEIGNAIEELYKDNIDEHYGVLVEHYVWSENYEKGAEYSRLSARRAEKAYSLNDAIAYTEKRIACIKRLPQTDDQIRKRIDSTTALGLYHLQFNHHFEAKEAVEPILELALELDYRRRLCQIHIIMGTYCFFIEEDFSGAFRHLEEALRISKEEKDIVSTYFANYWLSVVLGFNCEFERAAKHLQQTIGVNVARDNLWGVSLMKSSLSLLSYNFGGRIDLAHETSQEALRIAEECGDIYSKAMACYSHGFSCRQKGFLEEAKRCSFKAVDFCERVNLLLWLSFAHSLLGHIYYDEGEFQKSMDHYDKTIGIMDRINLLPSYMNFIKICLARARAMQDKKDIDLESLYKYQDGNKIKFFDGIMATCIGEILLNIDDQRRSEAEGWIKKAMKVDKRNGVMWQLGRDYVLYAELSKSEVDKAKTKENLTKAIEIYKECGADGWVKKCEGELASLA